MADFSLPGAPDAAPTAINNLGQIAGTINNKRQVVGTYTDRFLTPEPGYVNGAHGFVCRDGTLTEITAPEGAPTFPVEINDRGQAIGIYPSQTASIVDHGFLSDVPPPPATWRR